MDQPGIRTKNKPMGNQQLRVRGGAVPPGLAQPCGCSPPTPFHRRSRSTPALCPLTPQRVTPDSCMRCALCTCGGGEDAPQGRGAEHQEHQVRDWPHPPLGAQAAGPAPGQDPAGPSLPAL